MMNYPEVSASPSRGPAGSKVSRREPALLCMGPVLGTWGFVPGALRRMVEAAESHFEG